MERRTDVARCCATIGAKEAKPLEWDRLAEAVNKRNPEQAPISVTECQYVPILIPHRLPCSLSRNCGLWLLIREIISHYMHNYGYPNYETSPESYPPLRNPWVTDEAHDSPEGETKAGSKIDQKHDGSPWEEDTPDVQMPRPVLLSPPKPRSDVIREQQAAEKLVSTWEDSNWISGSRKDGR